MTSMLDPVRFDAPLVNPANSGLWAVTAWSDTTEPLRWLPAGVEIRRWNHGFGDGFGVWAAAWNAAESDLDPAEDVKLAGERPEPLPAFAAVTTWAADACDLLAPSRDETRTRAAQIHRLREPVAVEEQFAARMLDDLDSPAAAAADLVAAIGLLDEALAITNTLGVIHARPRWLSVAAKQNLLVRSGTVLKTPSGHTWVFGGGYTEVLEDTVIATSPTFGWRGQVSVRTAEDVVNNRFHAVAERSLVVGYEALIGAVTITGGSGEGEG